MGEVIMDLRLVVVSILIGIIVIGLIQHVSADTPKSWKVLIKTDQNNKNSTYWPQEIQARKSETIEWINADSVGHTVTSGVTTHLDYAGKIFDSGIISPGKEFRFTLPNDAWSSYYYFCKIHPWMTGKIDAINPYLEKSPIFDIATDKSSYSNGDTIRIEGHVNDTYQKTPLTLQIFDQDRNLVFLETIDVLKDNTYSYEMPVSSSVFKNDGNYKIKAFYGFPSTVTDINFAFTSRSETEFKTHLQSIPNWVRNDVTLWTNQQVSDYEFVNAIQYLAQNKIIKTSASINSETKMSEIPNWIRNNVRLWSHGEISDEDFISNINYLIEHGIIKI